jgi:hypothetical protein
MARFVPREPAVSTTRCELYMPVASEPDVQTVGSILEASGDRPLFRGVVVRLGESSLLQLDAGSYLYFFDVVGDADARLTLALRRAEGGPDIALLSIVAALGGRTHRMLRFAVPE